MKNKTILNIMAMAQSYKDEIVNGMPSSLAFNGSSLKLPTFEEIREYRKEKQKEYEQWLEQEVEECE